MQFLSTPSARRATRTPLQHFRPYLFLSTPSARRATLGFKLNDKEDTISIHALREEGDLYRKPEQRRNRRFLSTPSARRATRAIRFQPVPRRKFLSTPSARRATIFGEGTENALLFLSTPSARRATQFVQVRNGQGQFLSTPSARRATFYGLPPYAAFGYFYPRPPRGGRPPSSSPMLATFQFLSTPSARRATAKTETKSLFSYKLYNILHEFRRALIYNGSKNYPNHAK